MAALKAHQWPGNVRELRNAITRAVIIRKKGLLSARDLPHHVLGLPPDEEPSTFRVGMTLEQVERVVIKRTFLASDRNLSRTAAMLDIETGTAYKALASCGLGPSNGKPHDNGARSAGATLLEPTCSRLPASPVELQGLADRKEGPQFVTKRQRFAFEHPSLTQEQCADAEHRWLLQPWSIILTLNIGLDHVAILDALPLWHCSIALLAPNGPPLAFGLWNDNAFVECLRFVRSTHLVGVGDPNSSHRCQGRALQRR